ncbi:MAG: DUF3857 domain-containing protein [Verrucomicrobiota bacterium]
MPNNSPFITRLLPCILSITLLPIASAAKSALEEGGWETIPDEELKASEPRINKDSPVEFTFRSLYVNDTDIEDTEFSYHNRAKIFTEAGVQEWDKIDLEYQTGWRVSQIKARVIYPNGTVNHLDKKDIFTRKIYKDDKFEGNSKSFSFPGLKPGCIVEYKWKMTRAYWSWSLYIPLMAEWPTWQYDIAVRPTKSLASTTKRFNSGASWKKVKGKWTLTAKNLLPLSDKPYLAPRRDFEPWVFLEYAYDLDQLTGEEYWGYRAGRLDTINDDFIKAKSKIVKDLAKQLFNGLATREEKLQAAYKYCTEEITNVSEYTDKYTEEEIEDLKENKSPADTIKRGYGTRYDINSVFASLCVSLEVSPVLINVENKDIITFHMNHQGAYNLADWVVTLQDGAERRYFDPGSSFLPFEVLNTRNSGSKGIYTTKKMKVFHWVDTPPANEDNNTTKRIANVSIDEYGDLKGDVRLGYKGYSAIQRKRLFVSLTPKEREDFILDNEWRSRLPRAKVENVTFKNDDNRKDSLIVEYKIEIPGYADFVGDRAILNPSLFEVGRKPIFVEDKRHEPIDFDFKYSIQDQVSINLPEGYQPETDSDYGTKVDNAVASRMSKIQRNPETGELVFQRLFTSKLEKLNAKYYSQIKQMFEQLSQVDAQPHSFIKAENLASVSE